MSSIFVFLWTAPIAESMSLQKEPQLQQQTAQEVVPHISATEECSNHMQVSTDTYTFLT